MSKPNYVFRHLDTILREAGVEVSGVLHVGAHRGEEVPIYRSCGLKHITLVEPNSDNYPALRLLGVRFRPYAITQKEGRCRLCIPLESEDTDDVTMMASLRKPITPYKEIEVTCRTLDFVREPEHDLLVVDVEGAEVDVLKSGSLKQFKVIVIEKLFKKYYEDQNSPEEIHDFLVSSGFKLFREIIWKNPRDRKNPLGSDNVYLNAS